ncbi:LppU/SCO3897 family protein [Catelliglobosispora koreensis]|uniref:LppU/SCO3897 family protein n=1 Tax=Catelliglobosispora koreensis TaxID=129052 RepID=UPI0003647977|nr:hypothetical protein [Catelliglobosispora koreensis]
MTEQNPATPETAPPAAPYGEPAAAPQKGGAGKKIVGIIVAVVVAILAFVVVRVVLPAVFNGSDPSNASVGDCLTEAPDVNDVKIVDCGDATAKQKVLGTLENKNQAEAEEECVKVEGAESYLLLSKDNPIKASSKGKVLCLGPKA